jgi:alpha-galactosidase
MPKIAFIGAGSTVFARKLLGDILSFPELADSIIALHDIDEQRLHTSEIFAQEIAIALNAHPSIESTTDRRAALDGANYVICMIQVAGYKPGTVIDFEIPKKYGLRQTIADTLGIGGIMRGLRTIPVLLSICQDMAELCPDALLLNYVNPMAINCWALDRATSIQSVGLCHSVPHTAGQLAHDIGIPIGEINYLAAGINHMAFYLKFERRKDGLVEDLYPQIHQVIAEGRVPSDNRVRYDMLQRLGYFVTESSEHFSEYVPWFIKRDRPDLIERYNVPLLNLP